MNISNNLNRFAYIILFLISIQGNNEGLEDIDKVLESINSTTDLYATSIEKTLPSSSNKSVLTIEHRLVVYVNT